MRITELLTKESNLGACNERNDRKMVKGGRGRACQAGTFACNGAGGRSTSCRCQEIKA